MLTESALLVVTTDDTFAATVLDNEKPVLVDFWAEWCPPCKMISRSLAELAEEFAGRVVIATVDSDDNPRTGREYSIMSLPTLLMFRGGTVAGSIVGSRPKTQLRQALETLATG